MEIIMAKKVSKRMKAGDKRREAETHSHPGNKESGDVTSPMAMALLCASEGLRVVPLYGVKKGLCTCGNEHCEQPGRHPRTKNGLKDATTDPEKIKRMWGRWPKAKAGIPLGTHSRVLALVSEGATGKASLRKLLEHNEALMKTVTIRDGECLTRLFRIPEGCTVHHRELGHGLTILGDGDLVLMPSRTGIAKPGFLKGWAVGKVEIAEAPKWLIDQCARQIARVLKTDEIKIADIVVGKNRRSLKPEKVTEIAESIATIGQTTAITVRRTEDGKLILVDGLYRLRAIESLGGTHIRAEIMEGDDVEARLWELAALLHRADDLTALEKAERIAEWVRLTEGRAPVSGQNVQKLKGGRPQSGVAKAARQLPVKGKTQEARRKRIERAIKIAAISSEAKAAIRKAGLDEHHSALGQIAREKDRKAQVAKVQEIAARKAGAQRGVTRGTKKRTSKVKQAAPTATSASGEPIDIPAGGSPPTVPAIGADVAAAEIERLKAELADKTENLREAQEELQQARRAAASASEPAVTSPLSPAASDDDLEMPATLDRRPLSGEDQAMLTALISAWKNAPELQRAFANASAVVRERFIAEVVRGNRQDNSERQV
jgi:Bifunctional DNA primase/polymerase, N-terminal/ParB-like nuclease domain